MHASKNNRKIRETKMPLNRDLRFPFPSKHRNHPCDKKQDKNDNPQIHHKRNTTNKIITYFLEHTLTMVCS